MTLSPASPATSASSVSPATSPAPVSSLASARVSVWGGHIGRRKRVAGVLAALAALAATPASARVSVWGGHIGRRKRVAAVSAALALLMAAAGCGGSGGTAGGGGGGTADSGTVTVLAAASLSRAFPAIGAAFERVHPGLRVQLSFAGSQTLVAQARQGAPAAVLATADLATLQGVADQLRGQPVVFAHNQLALVTAPGNPLGLRSLQDLDRPGLKVVLAGPTVPAGKAAANALAAAHVTLDPVSLEDAVTGVVTKVRLGEADAGIAYATDLEGSGADIGSGGESSRLGGVALPGTETSLAIAAVAGAPEPEAADLFIAYVQGEVGQEILRSYGFR